MEFQTVIEKRRSIRNFDPGKEVSREQIETLIRAAERKRITTVPDSPPWKNQQTSRYYCILSPSRIEEFRQKCLSESNQKNCAGAPALIITTFKKGIVGFDKATGSPVNEAGDGWGYYDLGLQNENLVLKAAELDLGTLIMGIRDEPAIREYLKIPETEIIVAVIAVGYPAAEPSMPKRKAVEEIAT